ncbi:MAG: hypothetical protein SGJ20_03800 [Planctomycetota bacterium]|nr:hypothetical protein [Planctomycetota bacterium]
MTAYVLLILSLAGAVRLCAQAPQQEVIQATALTSLPDSAPSILVLKNGEVLTGRVIPAGDRYQVLSEGGELRIRRSDVDLVAQSIDDAYRLKLAAIPPGKINAHLDLAEWCMKQRLYGYVAEQLSIAVSIQPRHDRIAPLEQQLRKALDAETTLATSSRSPKSTVVSAAKAEVSRPVESIAELDRLVRSLPEESIEDFTISIQPLLVSSCATAGCHAPGNKSSFTMLRLPNDRQMNRRLTQRNLSNVIQLVNFKNPAESRLLTVTTEPHGSLATGIFTGRNATRQEQIIRWVSAVTEKTLEVPSAKDTQPSDAEKFPSDAPASAFNSPAATDAPNRPLSVRTAPQPVSNRTPGKSSPQSPPGTVPPTRDLPGSATTPRLIAPNQPAQVASPVDQFRDRQTFQKPRAKPVVAPVAPVDPFDPAEFNKQYLK